MQAQLSESNQLLILAIFKGTYGQADWFLRCIDYLPRISRNIVLQNLSKKKLYLLHFVLSQIYFLQFLQISHLWVTVFTHSGDQQLLFVLPLNHTVCVYMCVFILLGLLYTACTAKGEDYFLQLQALNDQGDNNLVWFSPSMTKW